ncbi:MAG: acetyl-CoA carboxylase biotin carboxyl carrier protein [Oscillospiraceae bacterium]|nr:acetyl-CoA carboxylase biotin carboxyl carrier protein [Oscillospiraceae bacterium]
MDIENIRQLAAIARENGLTLLETDGQRVRIERAAVQPAGGAAAAVPAVSAAAPAQASEAAGTPVTASLVGVFYAAPAPGEKPFVQVGDKVKKGDTLCIIEAMKLMNEIPADRDGEILEVCVSDAQVVEYGQVLFRVG